MPSACHSGAHRPSDQPVQLPGDGGIPVGHELRRLVGRIVTDSRPAAAPKDPERCNLFALYRHLAQPAAVAALRARYLEGGVAYGEGKEELVELLDAAFGPARVAYRAFMADPAELERLLAAGAERARGRAAPMIDRVRSAVGLGQPPAGTPDDRLAQVS